MVPNRPHLNTPTQSQLASRLRLFGINFGRLTGFVKPSAIWSIGLMNLTSSKPCDTRSLATPISVNSWFLFYFPRISFPKKKKKWEHVKSPKIRYVKGGIENRGYFFPPKKEWEQCEVTSDPTCKGRNQESRMLIVVVQFLHAKRLDEGQDAWIYHSNCFSPIYLCYTFVLTSTKGLTRRCSI